jgi:pimeloyl-ACP methyl ester carboxylesterase
MKKYIKDVCGLATEFILSEGNSDPIFIFHGNSSCASAYAPLLASNLGKKYQLVSVSLPGHGDSAYYQSIDNLTSIARLGEFTHQVTQLFTSNRYILVGQSLGGHALLESLHLHDKAVGLCLISAPPFSLDTIGNVFLEDPTQGLLFKNDLSDAEINRFVSSFLHHQTPDNITTLTNHVKKTQGKFREDLGQSLQRGLIRDEIQSLLASALPTVMLRGGHDQFINSRYYESLSSPGWPVNIIDFPDAGHAINLDCPDQFEFALTQFIASRFKQDNNANKFADSSAQELFYAD